MAVCCSSQRTPESLLTWLDWEQCRKTVIWAAVLQDLFQTHSNKWKAGKYTAFTTWGALLTKYVFIQGIWIQMPSQIVWLILKWYSYNSYYFHLFFYPRAWLIPWQKSCLWQMAFLTLECLSGFSWVQFERILSNLRTVKSQSISARLKLLSACEASTINNVKTGAPNCRRVILWWASRKGHYS